MCDQCLHVGSEDADNILEDNSPVNEVEEFMLIARGGREW